MNDIQGQYRIVETPCFPNSWKVIPVNGRETNATHLFHPSIKDATEQVEKMFNGIVIETIYMEN